MPPRTPRFLYFDLGNVLLHFDHVLAARQMAAIAGVAHERIWDGLLAARCWRDLAKDDMGAYPLLEMTTPELQDLFEVGWEQVDQALHRGYAVVIRDQAESFLQSLCGDGDAYQPAAWAYLQLSLGALVREASERDAAKGKIIADVAASASPTAQDIADAIGAIDALFPCP